MEGSEATRVDTGILSNEGRIARLVHVSDEEVCVDGPEYTVIGNSIVDRLLNMAEGRVPDGSAARLEWLEMAAYRTKEWLDTLLAAEITFMGPKAAEIRHRAQELRRMFDDG